jgi:hypothetical protein
MKVNVNINLLYLRFLFFSSRLQDIIIFIVGGATFEEAKEVAFFNENNPSLKVILGSTTIHNSERFLCLPNDFIHCISYDIIH